jgi:hypothetical protein
MATGRGEKEEREKRLNREIVGWRDQGGLVLRKVQRENFTYGEGKERNK